MPSAKPKNAQAAPPAIGDYFAHKGFDDYSVRLKTGPLDDGFFSLRDEHITKCTTLEGAQRLAALMNQARDLARDYRLVCDVGGPHGTRDHIAGYIARHLATALDVPHRWIDLEEHTRDALREHRGHEGELANCFAFLDAAGTPATLNDFKARAMLRRQALTDRSLGYCNHDHAREVARAWRRSFDATVPAAERAAKVLADLVSSQPVQGN